VTAGCYPRHAPAQMRDISASRFRDGRLRATSVPTSATQIHSPTPFLELLVIESDNMHEAGDDPTALCTASGRRFATALWYRASATRGHRRRHPPLNSALAPSRVLRKSRATLASMHSSDIDITSSMSSQPCGNLRARKAHTNRSSRTSGFPFDVLIANFIHSSRHSRPLSGFLL
jgi:hypothetical protein